MNVLVTGATGFIGKRLVKMLLEQKQSVRVTTRNPESSKEKFDPKIQVVGWTPSRGTNVEDTDVIFHLAGSSIAEKRWTEKIKAEIVSSRVDSTSALVENIKLAKHKPKTLICASAIGYYGERGNDELDEGSLAGQDFLATVCQDWETAALQAERLGVRVVCLRIGLVLGPGGGALAKMLPVFKAFLGGPLGSGQQWMSWVHVQDVCNMALWAMQNDQVRGPLNVTAPHPETNETFTKVLATTLKRPAHFRVPPFALKLALGELAEAALQSQKVLPKKALELGFEFQYSRLEPALRASL